MEALSATVAVLPALHRPTLEGRLPEWLEVRWWHDPDEMVALAPQAEIGWFDLHEKPPVLRSIELATGLRWLMTAYAGVDWLPLADFERRGVVLSCGSGLTASQVAEYAVLGILAAAKGFPEIVRAQDRGEWLPEPAGERDLAGSRALLLGYGAIGQAVGRMLEGFGVAIEPVRSSDTGWRDRLSAFDWLVMSLPGTDKTRGMVGADEIAALKSSAVVVNCGRADTLDQEALVTALRERRIGGAVLDVTAPEPLPPGHPLWSLDNAIVTMHLSGIPTAASQARAAERFLRNCALFREGQPLEAQVDLARGY
ncbi:D-2-hydroxyacid dehydrogenase [Croceibacterium aestuarii]|uniref:D-2-hydroxyacid dehydrogenase n=1 Tax=Croceibacterium aestuarii TaxID=3064139 RepID=UPI00272DE0A1|nr:D-2-hydroxyacid dehydrogenase [Croceibacterium sp. D39]